MRFSLDIGYGTYGYPDKVARRLRALNVACGAVSVIWLAFGCVYFVEQGWSRLVLADFAMAAIVVTLPLLHRFGPTIAGYLFAGASYTGVFYVCSLLGTDSGMQLQYLAYAAGTLMILGWQRWRSAVVISAVAVALIVALEVLAPKDGGLVSPTGMLVGFIACVVGTASVLFFVVFYAVREAALAEDRAEHEFERSETLLVNVLPAAIAGRLKGKSPGLIADRHEEASILFADMVGFTQRTSAMTPAVTVAFLNEVFATFDRLVEQHGLEKIKTTGDNYMVVSGVPVARDDHAPALARFALEMLAVSARLVDPNGRALELRIGMASGPVVAGVVGTRKFFYDVWGDAVNVASRMESTGEAGRIQVSPEAHRRLKEVFSFEARGTIDVKGKGPMETWFLTGPLTAPGGG